MKALTIALLAVLAATAGCLDSGGDAPVQDTGLPYSAGSGTAADHGEPTRDDGDVDTQFDGLGWRATQTVTIRNDFGGAIWSDAQFANSNGDIHVMGWDEGDYQVVIEKSARGMTPQEAEDNLETIRIDHTDNVEGDRLRLATVIDVEERPGDLPLLSFNSAGNAHITVYLPRAPGHNLQSATSNGDLSASGIRGPSVLLESSNGDVHIHETEAGLIAAVSSNGDIIVQAKAANVAAATSSGDVHVDHTPVASGNLTIASSNGDVVVSVPGGDELAYELRAATSNGAVTLDLEDVEEVGQPTESTRHVRTIDYDARPVQVQVDLATSNGNVVAGHQAAQHDMGDDEEHDHEDHERVVQDVVKRFS
ncbi:MAG: DUF4097 family beta strand repeat-containing protein [Thermoplasmatota archaeon]